jgi:hypothetical protein
VTVAIKRGANVGSCVFRSTPLDAMSARIRRTRAISVSQSLDFSYLRPKLPQLCAATLSRWGRMLPRFLPFTPD